MRTRLRQTSGALLGFGLLLVVAGGARSAEPAMRLEGVPLHGPTHLRLLVAAAPPFIYDVDSNTVREIPGVVNSPNSVLSVSPSGTGVVAIVNEGGASGVHAVRIRADGSTRRLGSALNLIAAHHSTALWRLSRTAARCTLRLIPSSQPAIPVPCGFNGEDSAAGLHGWTADREFVLDARTGRVLAENDVGWGLGAVARDLVLERKYDPLTGRAPLRLINIKTGARRSVGWPSKLRYLDGILPQPHGTLVAVGFADPSTSPQSSDIWILDRASGRFTHLPGMPAYLSLKFSSMAWTSDDRLVLLVERDERPVLAVWKPGSQVLQVRELKLPKPSGGSDSFVPLVRLP